MRLAHCYAAFVCFGRSFTGQAALRKSRTSFHCFSVEAEAHRRTAAPIDILWVDVRAKIRMATFSQKKTESIGGWGGIRTLETLARLPVFKTGAFNHSATHPRNKLKWLVRSRLATNRELQPGCNRGRNISVPAAFQAGQKSPSPPRRWYPRSGGRTGLM
jgi:hypothetical protein